MPGPSGVQPTRTQKRWASRLRTAGALLLLLAGVGLVDRAVGLAAPARRPDALGGQALPSIVLLFAAAVGATCFALGRRWGR